MRPFIRNLSCVLFLLSTSCAQHSETPTAIQVGAWYFTAWHPSNQIHTQAALSTYGRKDVWGGIRDHAEGQDPFGWKTDYAARKPALGFYNQQDPEVIRKHLQWAKEYGLDFFGIYWYWNSVTHQPDPINEPIKLFKTVDQQEGLPFFLAPFVLGGVTLEEWKTKVVPAFVKEARDQNYYRVSNRPLVAVLYPGLQTPDLKAGMDALRDQMKQAFGQHPILLWTLFTDQVKPEDLQFIYTQVGVDGFTCLHFPPHAQGEPYPETLERWEKSTEQMSAYPHMPCISTGFDPRPWFKVGTDPLDTYNTWVTPETFEQFLPQVRDYLLAHSEKTSRHVMVYAFNEWGEGGIIEPSEKLGDRYLRALTVFGK